MQFSADIMITINQIKYGGDKMANPSINGYLVLFARVKHFIVTIISFIRVIYHYSEKAFTTKTAKKSSGPAIKKQNFKIENG